MKVTSVRIFPLQGNPSIAALADIVLDNGFAVSDLRVMQMKDGGYCVLYPVSQHSTAANVRHICNPINRPTQQLIESVVLEEFRRQRGGQ